MPPPPWVKREEQPKRRAEPIDVAPIRAAWDQIHLDRERRYEARGVSLENRGSRARCRRCGEVLMDVPRGLVGVTPTALVVMHAQQTGCR